MEIYKCELCDIIFNNFQLKANHVRWYHRDNSIGNKKNSKTKMKAKTINKRKGIVFNIIDPPRSGCFFKILLTRIFRPWSAVLKQDCGLVVTQVS
jgi:hypothetical protein